MAKHSYKHGNQIIEYETVTRYVLTHIDKDGFRRLSFANQGRYHFDSAEDGEAYLKIYLEVNSEETLALVHGEQAIGTFKIIPAECYHHGDCCGIYFDE